MVDRKNSPNNYKTVKISTGTIIKKSRNAKTCSWTPSG